MSGASIIASVTTELAHRVRSAAQSVIPGADVLTTHPDGKPLHHPRVRLFLYRATPNVALSNDDLPSRQADGTLVVRTSVALDLHYLLAFYGDENQLEPQKMLGAVVRELHTRPMLAKSSLADAVERVRFTPQHLSLDEMSKLWSIFFQAPYALSIAYQCSVVTIHSETMPSPVLPVLQRGKGDTGPLALPGAYPLLDNLHIGEPADRGLQPRPPSYPAAQLGHLLTLNGQNLGGDVVKVIFTHLTLAISKTLVIADADCSATEIAVQLPDDAAALNDWAAGFYKVTVELVQAGVVRTTNPLSFALAPKLLAIAPANPVPRIAGKATLTLNFKPAMHGSQTVSLQMADREVAAGPWAMGATSLTFEIADAPSLSNTSVRLRVDGVDSLPYIKVYTPPPARLEFDPQQQVTLL